MARRGGATGRIVARGVMAALAMVVLAFCVPLPSAHAAVDTGCPGGESSLRVCGPSIGALDPPLAILGRLALPSMDASRPTWLVVSPAGRPMPEPDASPSRPRAPPRLPASH